MNDSISMKVATACLGHGTKTAHAHAQKLLAAEKREEKKAKDAEKKAKTAAKATKEAKPEGSEKTTAPKSKTDSRKEPKTEYMRRKRSFMDK